MDYKSDVRPEDNMEESVNKIINAHTSGDVVIIVGECTVDYSGRAWTYLDLGKRSVRINPSGAVVVSGCKSVKPKNWQPSDATTNIELDDDNDIIVNSVRKDDESLSIRFTNISKSIHYDPPEKEVEVEGTENDLHNKLIEEPKYIEEGMNITEHEKTIETGDIDLFGYDKDNNKVIIEVKRRKAQIKNVDQLNRYVKTYKDNCRGVLVAPAISESADNYLDTYDYEFIRVDIAKIFDKK
jgi:RecB family endonuclease NucS